MDDRHQDLRARSIFIKTLAGAGNRQAQGSRPSKKYTFLRHDFVATFPYNPLVWARLDAAVVPLGVMLARRSEDFRRVGLRPGTAGASNDAGPLGSGRAGPSRPARRAFAGQLLASTWGTWEGVSGGHRGSRALGDLDDDSNHVELTCCGLRRARRTRCRPRQPSLSAAHAERRPTKHDTAPGHEISVKTRAHGLDPGDLHPVITSPADNASSGIFNVPREDPILWLRSVHARPRRSPAGERDRAVRRRFGGTQSAKTAQLHFGIHEARQTIADGTALGNHPVRHSLVFGDYMRASVPLGAHLSRDSWSSSWLSAPLSRPSRPGKVALGIALAAERRCHLSELPRSKRDLDPESDAPRGRAQAQRTEADDHHLA